MSHVTVAGAWESKGYVPHVTFSEAWREKGKVSHVTVSGGWVSRGHGVTCDGLEMGMEGQGKWVSGVIYISIYWKSQGWYIHIYIYIPIRPTKVE